MKTIKSLLIDNNLKKESDYFEMIMKHYYRGNHIKSSELFQDLKKDKKEYFLCEYLRPEPFSKVIKFFIKELLI